MYLKKIITDNKFVIIYKYFIMINKKIIIKKQYNYEVVELE